MVGNWLQIMSRTKKLTAFTASYSQAAIIFPYILVAPAYFAQKVQLGGMMQTASAFGSVQEAPVVLRHRLPDLGGMAGGGGAARRLRNRHRPGRWLERTRRSPSARRRRARRRIALHGLTIDLPDHKPLLAVDGLQAAHRR
ncbi:MAG: hypothetical protein MZV49_18580 [Rhodopseudomonas palustris]|nr:hypothetical protein [Rhodopseudomonas palustris]